MPASDAFNCHSTGLESPLTNAIEITPSDVDDLLNVTRAVHLGIAGSLRVTMKSGQVVTFSSIDAGWHPLRIVRIHETGTTASGFIGAW